jgi:NAD(P)-dependent dehydrogenase (short-subunit alcohol dehydrogenase family)
MPAADGHHIMSAVAADRATAVAAAIQAAGGSAEAVAFDVTDRAATAAALEALLEGGAIQIVVNNAGIHADAVFPGMSGEQWDRVVDVSLNGFFNVTQPLTMPMIRTRWGRIVNVSSVAAIAGNRGQVNYSAAKGALHAASKSLARNWRPGIRSRVTPGVSRPTIAGVRRGTVKLVPISARQEMATDRARRSTRLPTSRGRSSRSTARWSEPRARRNAGSVPDPPGRHRDQQGFAAVHALRPVYSRKIPRLTEHFTSAKPARRSASRIRSGSIAASMVSP